MSIKTKLIHWLGGYTKEELEDYRKEPINELLDLSKRLYGISPEVWCKSMYNQLTSLGLRCGIFST